MGHDTTTTTTTTRTTAEIADDAPRYWGTGRVRGGAAMIATRRTDCDECGTYTTAIHGYEGWLCQACLDASLYGPRPVECPQCGGAQRIVEGEVEVEVEGEGEVRCPGCAGWGFVDHLKGA